MDWHDRYRQQAGWTRGLRSYLFDKSELAKARRVLEVGCGTGAVFLDLSTRATLHGLDLSNPALRAAHQNAAWANLVEGNALALPYVKKIFDITYCHFLLLWVKAPLQSLLEMKRVTKANGYVLALAEPDYTGRADLPSELARTGGWQTESLRRQGADVGIGPVVADLFDRAGMRVVEAGTLQRRVEVLSEAEHESEWAVLESDLTGLVPEDYIRRMKHLDYEAWSNGTRETYVPTYFVWGQVSE
jgi:ubiquinone/menaquinone biosynthesis C-methylase UbiE